MNSMQAKRNLGVVLKGVVLPVTVMVTELQWCPIPYWLIG